MGIYSRDYLREDYSDPPRFAGLPGSVCKTIIIANVVVFVLQMATVKGVASVTEWLNLGPRDIVPGGQIWRVLTYAFCHSPGDVLHILFNMLFVWWFGKTLESMYGFREFLLFYLTAAVVAGLCFVGLGIFLEQLNPAIGASGAVMAIMMVYAMHYPRQLIYLMGIIPIEIRWLVAFYVVYDSWPILQSLGGINVHDGIAHSAHLGGLLFGYLYVANGIRLERWVAKFRLPRLDRFFGSRRSIKIYKPGAGDATAIENLDERVDAILAKIHEQGEASLTNSEREILKMASRKYKNR